MHVPMKLVSLSVLTAVAVMAGTSTSNTFFSAKKARIAANNAARFCNISSEAEGFQSGMRRSQCFT